MTTEQLTLCQIHKCSGCDCYLNYICTAQKDWQTCDDKIETIEILKEVE
jgi:hypothetical protein